MLQFVCVHVNMFVLLIKTCNSFNILKTLERLLMPRVSRSGKKNLTPKPALFHLLQCPQGVMLSKNNSGTVNFNCLITRCTFLSSAVKEISL